jgi:hypothetical protein
MRNFLFSFTRTLIYSQRTHSTSFRETDAIAERHVIRKLLLHPLSSPYRSLSLSSIVSHAEEGRRSKDIESLLRFCVLLSVCVKLWGWPSLILASESAPFDIPPTLFLPLVSVILTRIVLGNVIDETTAHETHETHVHSEEFIHLWTDIQVSPLARCSYDILINFLAFDPF